MQFAFDGRATCQNGFIMGLDERCIVACQEIGRTPPDDLLGLQAEEFGIMTVEHREPAAEILHEHRDRGVIHEGAQPRLAVAQAGPGWNSASSRSQPRLPSARKMRYSMA
jgi:hypothetical protein